MFGELSKLLTKTEIGASVRLIRTSDSFAPLRNEVGRFTVYCSAPRCRTEFGWATICRTDSGTLYIAQFTHPPCFTDRDEGSPSLIEMGNRAGKSRHGATRKAAGFSRAERRRMLEQVSPEMRQELIAGPWLGQVKAPDGRPLPKDYSIPGIELPKLLRCPSPTCGEISVLAWEVVPLIRTSTAA